ncbi:MAG: CpsD/CapB family tyrosine-protein kinase [Clostridia bacterium]|nr:CpsD/CapB family tyrosine-protein kinase [Clostridia bacterium]
MNTLSINRFSPLNYAGAEAVNMLCTNLSFSGENVKKIMLTSCHASEGKSFLSMNVMRTLAKLGKSVVLVDADLRRSMLVQRYGIQFEQEDQVVGLSHLLAGMVEEADVVYETNIPGAYMVPVGRKVSNSLPLLNSSRFQRLLDDLAAEFDYVILDAPPIGLVIDAAQIAKYCDGTVFVVGYNTVRRQELMDAKEQIEATGCPILGAVLNQTEYDNYLSKKYSYKSYYSHYGYYQKEESAAEKKGKKE